MATSASTPGYEELIGSADAAARGARRLWSRWLGRGRRRRSLVASGIWALAALPTIALTLVGSMAVRVRLAEGRWPSLNMPDPKTLGPHNTVTLLAIVGSVVAVVVVPIVALVLTRWGGRRLPRTPPLLAVVGFAVLVIVLRADLGGLGQWLAD